jgi:hypothetical protein
MQSTGEGSWRGLFIHPATRCIRKLVWNNFFQKELQMKKTFAAAGLMLSLFAIGAFAENLNGTISDEHCGAKHVAGTAADQKCAAKCIGGGAAPVLVSGDKVYKIENPDAVKGHEGHKVTVSGNVSGDSVHVDSVKM